ncbi:helix-turn-helix domain-containing protein [Mucilaginibacter sp. SMC90]|uniref:helix-turn-helix domain-containing protein n=1 Tax=Mucilaginibacter sp. SMC90 TaxID=2929803 RepID=UPI001FB25EA0|nr:helix-turn-helix domain-containing protein [Mucilaginibacter sp. SMC90]UOE52617.1 helix-turn-helix domain-containing protein [Mucilaginibacter sp. SMC90]
MSLELITKDDLENFRQSLLDDIKLIIQPPVKPTDEWLRCSDVRKLLKISTGTIQNLRISGKLKSNKVGGIHLYKRSDVENMITGKGK